MASSSPLFKRWLGQIGADQVVEVLTDLFENGAAFIVDSNSDILLWSKGAEQLFGLSATDTIGKPCKTALNCDNGNDPCNLAELGIVKSQAVRIQHPYGRTLHCYRTARAFYDSNGGFAGAIEFLQPQSNTAPEQKPDDSDSFHGILSRDPAMKEAIKIIRNVAETEATVLIRGESGTGKEMVAHALHLESPRHYQPFLAINCAALTPSLLESELFGHVKGAFTGAVRNHAGLFQRANGGTLFLDEIAELPLELQAKLLRVIQERNFIPVGGDSAVSVDVRIIAATHRSLREEVKAGHFREDLMYRLRVVPIFLPPLRERRQDISLLLQHLIDRHNTQGHRHIDSIAPEAMRLLLDYRWPGNVRELNNVVEYAYAVGRGSELSIDDLPPEFREPVITFSPAASNAQRSKSQNEAELIREALQNSPDNLEQAAQYAGMSRATFWRKRRKYGL
ncbi:MULTISPECIES: sigma-54 interaction domain-containing protein [Methylomonas]|uniref:Fis family transcriptional regulator n=2 Tax=Methylomonas TaxID=416 RepID=A0A126T5R0_9GAMM|nr:MULTISPECIES: sigma-54-dependent Fis family transcriptional regulator [Methylomonas]AMK77406.1 Fis family transcriptional regulator [Methylomonas denitrificans]OAI05189.1 sigma-54-dependent Fis family transcriptional regulator [Methylomonas methanica]TCV84554.1 transcriptional regulator with PAS, ATPase and Fis domain [Methylomonas methanica]